VNEKAVLRWNPFLALGFWTILISVVLDQMTKYAAIVWLREHPPIVFIWDLFRLQFATNTGAFLSLFSGLPDSYRAALLIGLNSVILTGIGVYLVRKTDGGRWMTFALALILSGGVGNLIDRVGRGGVVIDFMNVGITTESFSVRSGIFNIADLAIVGGLVMLLVGEIFLGASAKKA